MLITVLLSFLSSFAAHASCEDLRFNELQAKGTHNSYHIASSSARFHQDWNYSHHNLTQQLDEGVRQLELDVHLRNDGEFTVHHVEFLDQKTVCYFLKDCLTEIAKWSAAHPKHVPLLIWLELKDKDLDRVLPNYQKLSRHFPELEEAVLKAYPREKLVTPEMILGSHKTLPESVRSEGWPKLSEIQGKTFIALLASAADSEIYYGKEAVFSNKLFFTSANAPTDPYAAFFKPPKAPRNIEEASKIKDLVHQGFIVTAMADHPDSRDSENENSSHLSIESGAQFVSTNYTYAQKRGYWFDALNEPTAFSSACTALEK